MVTGGGQKNLPIIEGHKMGSEIIKKIVGKSLELRIKYLTFYSFSTEIGISKVKYLSYSLY